MTDSVPHFHPVNQARTNLVKPSPLPDQAQWLSQPPVATSLLEPAPRGERSEQTFLQREYTSGQLTHEEKPNIMAITKMQSRTQQT